MIINQTQFSRSAGVLMHITSLAGEYGIGTFGKEAFHFIDFLADCGFTWWQTLPFGPVDACWSPYKSLSAFTGNLYLIDLEDLAERNLLYPEELQSAKSHAAPYHIDCALIAEKKEKLLRLAWNRATPEIKNAVLSFMKTHPHIKDSALYFAIVNQEYGVPWHRWQNDALKKRDPQALKHVHRQLKDEIDFHIFIQYLFFSQWANVKEYANAKGIKIIGDLPIYVDLDSCDVWQHPEYFSIDADGHLKSQAGVPPDYFSEEGQLWRNPLYQWENMKKDGFMWWKDRLNAAFEWFDAVRIDHFRAFSAYWSVPGESLTAKDGQWEKGPGIHFFNTLSQSINFSQSKIIAEDLGTIDDAVRQLISETGFPGMRVMQFAFLDRENNLHLPHQYPENVIAYTGTHDNNTLLGWLWASPEDQRQYALDYIGFDQQKNFWGEGGPHSSSVHAFIETLWKSHAALTIVPVQDLLGFGEDTRMNVPGKADGNWMYRITEENLNQIDREWIRKINRLYFR